MSLLVVLDNLVESYPEGFDLRVVLTHIAPTFVVRSPPSDLSLLFLGGEGLFDGNLLPKFRPFAGGRLLGLGVGAVVGYNCGETPLNGLQRFVFKQISNVSTVIVRVCHCK